MEGVEGVEGSERVSGSDKVVSDETSIGSFTKFGSPIGLEPIKSDGMFDVFCCVGVWGVF